MGFRKLDEVEDEGRRFALMHEVDSDPQERYHVRGCPAIETQVQASGMLLMRIKLDEVAYNGALTMYLKEFTNRRSRNGENLADIARDRGRMRNFDLRVQHL